MRRSLSLSTALVATTAILFLALAAPSAVQAADPRKGKKLDKKCHVATVTMPTGSAICKKYKHYSRMNKVNSTSESEKRCAAWRKCWGDDVVNPNPGGNASAQPPTSDQVCKLSSEATDWMTTKARLIGDAATSVQNAIDGLQCEINKAMTPAKSCDSLFAGAKDRDKLLAKAAKDFALAHFGTNDAKKQKENRKTALNKLIKARDDTFKEIKDIALQSEPSCQACDQFTDWYAMRAAVYFVNYTRYKTAWDDKDKFGYAAVDGQKKARDFAGLFADGAQGTAYNVNNLTPKAFSNVAIVQKDVMPALKSELCNVATHLENLGDPGHGFDDLRPSMRALQTNLETLALEIEDNADWYDAAVDAKTIMSALDKDRAASDNAARDAIAKGDKKASVKCVGEKFKIYNAAGENLALDNSDFKGSMKFKFIEFAKQYCPKEAAPAGSGAGSGGN